MNAYLLKWCPNSRIFRFLQDLKSGRRWSIQRSKKKSADVCISLLPCSFTSHNSADIKQSWAGVWSWIQRQRQGGWGKIGFGVSVPLCVWVCVSGFSLVVNMFFCCPIRSLEIFGLHSWRPTSRDLLSHPQRSLSPGLWCIFISVVTLLFKAR